MAFVLQLKPLGKADSKWILVSNLDESNAHLRL